MSQPWRTSEQRLAGKVALVTGASRGIGAAIAIRLAQEGARVALTYRNSKDQAENIVTTIETTGGRAIAVRADSTVDSELVAAVEETVAVYGGLDILINNAGGGGGFGTIDQVTPAEFDQTFAVNVRAVFVAIQAALPHLPDGGRIVNIGSINAHRIPTAGAAIYGAAKAAVLGLTKGLARDLGSRGISVTDVQPGPVDTTSNPANGPLAEAIRSWMALPRFGTVEEIAGFVAYLVGPEAGFITGASLDIDGGFGA